MRYVEIGKGLGVWVGEDNGPPENVLAHNVGVLAIVLAGAKSGQGTFKAVQDVNAEDPITEIKAAGFEIEDVAIPHEVTLPHSENIGAALVDQAEREVEVQFPE